MRSRSLRPSGDAFTRAILGSADPETVSAALDAAPPWPAPPKPETPTIRALRILRDWPRPGVFAPSLFGRKLWPNHPAWRNQGKCGRGSSRGVGMRLGAGGFIGRLCAAGLISRGRYRTTCPGLTEAGEALLAKAGA